MTKKTQIVTDEELVSMDKTHDHRFKVYKDWTFFWFAVLIWFWILGFAAYMLVANSSMRDIAWTKLMENISSIIMFLLAGLWYRYKK